MSKSGAEKFWHGAWRWHDGEAVLVPGGMAVYSKPACLPDEVGEDVGDVLFVVDHGGGLADFKFALC